MNEAEERFKVTKREFPRGRFTWWIEDSHPAGRKRGPFTSVTFANLVMNDAHEQHQYENEGA